jgi:hypothetical protein
MTILAIYSFSRSAVGNEHVPTNDLAPGLFPVIGYSQDVFDLLDNDEKECVKGGPMHLYKRRVREGDAENELK